MTHVTKFFCVYKVPSEPLLVGTTTASFLIAPEKQPIRPFNPCTSRYTNSLLSSKPTLPSGYLSSIMKLAIGSLMMLLAATTVMALPTPTPEQALPDSCIIPLGEADGAIIRKRCPIGLELRGTEETSCIIYESEGDGSVVRKRCPIGLGLETR